WPRMWGYHERPRAAFRRWCRDQAVPCSTHRGGILSRYAPDCLSEEQCLDLWLRKATRTGWMNSSESVTPAEYRRGYLDAERRFGPTLEQFRLSAVADRAVREVLRLGRRHHFRTVLVLMPESTAFQELYPSPVRAEIDAYLGSLSREYQVPVVD